MLSGNENQRFSGSSLFERINSVLSGSSLSGDNYHIVATEIFSGNILSGTHTYII
jgi:hypothetical protein